MPTPAPAVPLRCLRCGAALPVPERGAMVDYGPVSGRPTAVVCPYCRASTPLPPETPAQRKRRLAPWRVALLALLGAFALIFLLTIVGISLRGKAHGNTPATTYYPFVYSPSEQAARDEAMQSFFDQFSSPRPTTDETE